MVQAVRIDAASRWDAVALTSHLGPYRWHLLQLDAEHWQVHLQLDSENERELPDDLLRRVQSWVADRRLEATTISTPDAEYRIGSA